ncbi:MAG: DNA replication/repair protein RecF [Clostridia bacterium]|nr:DNA replication/repair protein RecF [Clostridia bacterium]
MWINEVNLTNFRNYSNQKIKLQKNINVFFGENAQGKTNIIESIFLGSIGKSFRTKKEKELIKFNEENAVVDISFKKIDREGKIQIKLGEKKQVFLNGIKIKKLSELLGNINTVIFTPEDINILKGGPENRRKFLDIMISQLRPNYIHVLTLYSKTLEQRNNYLKQIKLENKDENLLDIWDEKLVEYGIKIFEYRMEFIKKIQKKILNIHKEITENREEIEIKYFSDANTRQNFINELKSRRKLDIIKGFTTKGVHRDNFVIYINGKEVNVFGSQGQHRTAILSLRLSELKIVYDEIGEYPILLLDDFMSELDSKRRINFLENIKDIQVIITCTDKLTLEKLDYISYNVCEGKIVQEKL